jgi:hypothetical protein
MLLMINRFWPDRKEQVTPNNTKQSPVGLNQRPQDGLGSTVATLFNSGLNKKLYMQPKCGLSRSAIARLSAD